MSKRIMLILVLSVLVSGCTTFRSEQPMINQLQMRVGELERVIQAKDQRITELEYDVKDLTYSVQSIKGTTGNSKRNYYSKTSSSTKNVETATTVKDDDRIIRVDVAATTVQRALKNAGYYAGNIDGKVGSGTKKAIYKFQKDYNLKADGLIGQQTWAELKSFVE